MRLPSRAHILAGVVLAQLLGCYHPDTLDCTVKCTAATDCTGGQQCSGGWCVAPNIVCDHGNPVTVDAAMVVTPHPDADDGETAKELCEQGCSQGTCDSSGVCVIDCAGQGKCTMNDVQCPANLPCRVNCGKDSCTRKIMCTTASSCEVKCSGDGSCQDEIQCPNGDCSVTCSGPNSCKRRTRCTGSCACDVSCTGAMSCMEASECPTMACKVGNGCSSTPTGCDSCN